MITKDGKDVAIEMLTPENYKVPAGEERLYHCVIEQKKFHSTTGVKLSKPRVQKFNRKIYERVVESNLRKMGYTIIVLHDPTEWIKAHAEKVAKMKAEKAAGKEAAIQARIDKAVAEAVAAALAKKESKPKKAKSESAE